MTTTDMTPDREQIGWLPWVFWGLGALFYCYEFFLQVSTSVMIDDLMREFHISATALGNLSSFYLYFYAIMQIPVGMLLDRFGARRLLTAATLFCASGALMFAYAKVFTIAAIGRSLIGFGSSFAAVSCMHIAASWLPVRRFALMTGALLTIGMLGAYAAEGPLSQLIEIFGWRDTLVMFGLIGVVLSLLIYTIVRDRSVSENTGHNRVLETNFSAGLKYIVKQPRVWIASVYGGLMFLTIPGFTSLWGVPYLSKLYDLTKTQAAYINSITFIGFAVGAPFFGWFSDRIGRRKVPMYIAAIGSLVTFSYILYAQDIPLMTMRVLLFLFGFFISAFLPVFSLARELTPPETNSTTLGLVNTFNSFGGAAAQVGIGYLLDLSWDGTMQAGRHVYSLEAFHYALTSIPIALALGVITLFFVKETYCKQLENY